MLRLFKPSPRTVRLARFALTGAVLAALGTSAVWRLADGRLAAEARRRAEAGESRAVAVTRRDWAPAIVPVALHTPGEPGEAARAAASAKIDEAVHEAERGDPDFLYRVAGSVLDAIQLAERPPTDAGARWAEWLARRLAGAVELLGPRDRVTLLTRIDAKLSVLASIPRQYPANPGAPPEPGPIVLETPPSLDDDPAPPREPAPLVAAETRPAEPAPIAPAPRAGVQWRPEWTATQVVRTPASKPAAEEVAEEPPRTLADWSDRELLGELVELSKRLPPDQPQALGPTPSPRQEPHENVQRQADALRRELRARGFAAVRPTHIDALLSADQETRRGLVATLLSDRSVDAARLLLVLADDDSAEVRAAAISALGSSPSRPIVQIALEKATHDRDPRVGRLAEPIRQRLR